MNNRIDAIYARQSVDKKDSISIESQIEFCKYELKGGSCKEYTDKGYSGKNTDRPMFQELVRDIKRGLIAKVIVYKLDRISRSILDFANIAHGCNSVLATQMALTYGDYVITEAGFGADLGAEKFFNIKCRKAGLSPKLTVIVATAQSLKLHGGVPEAQIKEPNKEGLIRGFANLDKHIENMKNFGQQVIVTFNRFASDTDEEIALVAEHCKEKGVGFAVNTVFADGGKGAVELARLVAETIEKNPSKPLKFTYEESDSIRKKVRKIAEGIYGASSIVYTTLAEKKLKEIEKLGIAHFPVCIAKTQYSFSSDPKAYGVAKDFELKVRDIIINNGAEMIVVVMGEIMRMPGLPKEPQARHIDIVNGLIEGLS